MCGTSFGRRSTSLRGSERGCQFAEHGEGSDTKGTSGRDTCEEEAGEEGKEERGHTYPPPVGVEAGIPCAIAFVGGWGVDAGEVVDVDCTRKRREEEEKRERRQW